MPPRDFHRCTNETYSFDEPTSTKWFPRHKAEREDCERISKTIQFAIDRMGTVPRTAPSRELNYEDVIYLLHRLAQDSPVEPLLERTIERLRKCFMRNLGVDEADLHMLLIRTINCMTDLLRELLWDTRIKCTDHLNFVQRIVSEHGSANVTIATTNHDRVLERYLSLNGINFRDGFARDGAEKDLWRPQILDSVSDGIQLLKIHGSIDWYLIMHPDVLNHGREYARMDRPGGFLHPDGRGWTLYESQPRMVVGTLDKQEHYLTGITGDLICRFRRALKDSRLLLVCGCGFQDSGINRIIDEWVFGDLPRRMIVVGQDRTVVGKSEWGRRWESQTGKGVLRVTRKKLGLAKGDLRWPNVKSLLSE